MSVMQFPYCDDHKYVPCSGYRPRRYETGKVIPIFKAKSKESFNNYRPISLLSNISKVLEKVVHKRLYSFLARCDILCDKQYGFRPNWSTIDAVTDLTSDVLSSLDRNDMCLSVYLDLAKAFDTINHKILLNKLEYYGIRGRTLEWLRSYLDRRMQYVCYNGLKSETKPVEYGVPQGSVLGPLLFILYANDIPQCMSYCRTIIFADDTTVYQVGKDPHTMYRQVNFDLKTLTDWFKANQLSVNPSKTKSMLFKRSGYVNDINDYLCIETEPIELVQMTKFIGLYIDEHLTWQHHIDHCKKKASSGVYAINMCKYILSEKTLKMLYYSLVHPYIIYGIRLWGNAYQMHIKKLEVVQKKAIRAITGAKYNDASSPLFRPLKIMKFKDLRDMYIQHFVYEFVNDSLPKSLSHIFEYNRDIHRHNTRHSNDPRPLKANSDIMRRSLLCRGPILWIDLNIDIRNSRTKHIFKKRVMQNYLRTY